MKAISFLQCYNNAINSNKWIDAWISTILDRPSCVIREEFKEKRRQELREELLAMDTNNNENIYSHFEKVSQPFSFEKVVELFEGFELNQFGINHKTEDFGFMTETAFLYWVPDWESHNEFLEDCVESYGNIDDTNPADGGDAIYYYNIKTIDEFIVLCNNLNIELTWKQ